ncbi:hypothetical protein CMZ82_03400 [Lysobacteraceae bacterium NML93-0792]|nr:hypothetical protein CMZ82_03400 [Xanthomonadaceae bacterium NML93-0792]PBS15898.1 hypothetical protein CMZ81_08100 [Xanthomonadaceae bacterium NML93-0793]PBS18922.1 hypothetical protein CMZ80_09500 [Xanthomonadaceae bacterium NML93-0831]
MHGEFISVWRDSWREVWEPLIFSEGVPADIGCELYRGLVDALRVRPSAEEIADTVDDPKQGLDAFRAVESDELAGERQLVAFFENAYGVLDELDVEALTERYFVLLQKFIDKYSLRYDLRSPCLLCPTLPGFFSGLLRDLKAAASDDEHLALLIHDLEESIRDLRLDPSAGRIKTSIQKQVNMLEALGRSCSGADAGQLGAMCGQINSWPHPTIKKALSALYGFASEFPGIRHGGNPQSALREVEMRDLIAVLIVFTGFSPYLRDGFDANSVYFGS